MNPRRVLVIDDDEISRFITEHTVRRLFTSAEIDFAFNGYEGLNNTLKRSSSSYLIAPDLIILDHFMPVMNGMEYMQTFNLLDFVNKNEVVIILLSCGCSSSDKNFYKKLGVKEFLEKPLIEKDLLKICQKYWEECIKTI